MGRHKRKNNNVLGLFAIFVLAGLALKLLADNITLVLGIVFTVLAITALGFLAIQLMKNRARRRMLEAASSIIDQHLEALCRQRAKLVLKDAYGKDQLDKWHKEIDGFITGHIRPALHPRQQSKLDVARSEIRDIIVQHTENWTNPVFKAFDDSMTGRDFELFCAAQLCIHGWTAQATRATGDQGVDVIAERHGVRVVLQCKLYSDLVGNSAVQQAIGGKGIERAHHCAVVSNMGYTLPAKQLAAANDVHLLHYSDLAYLDKRLGLAPCAEPSSLEGSPPGKRATVTAVSQPKMHIPEFILDESNAASKMPLWLIASAAAVLLIFAAIALIPRQSEHRAMMINNHYSRPVANGYTRYNNERFGYSIDFPTFFVRRVSVNEDGMELISPDGAASLTMAAAKNDRSRTTKDFYNEAIASGSGALGYHILGGSWFVVTWENGDELVYEKMFVGNNTHDWFTFTFPKNQRHIYEPMVTAVEKSFRPGSINQTW